MLQRTYVLRAPGDTKDCISFFKGELPIGEIGEHRLLITIFTHWNELAAIREMAGAFRAAFPTAEIAGMTTSGGIQGGHVLLRQTVVSMQYFTSSQVQALLYDFSKRSVGDIGEDVYTFCRMKDAAAVALMITQQYHDLDPFYHALNRLPTNVPVVGGYADAFAPNEGTYVFDGHGVLSKGILAIIFSGQVKVLTRSVMGWQPLGHVMKVTATEGPLILKELDHKPAVYFYQKYLHSIDFSPSALPFPLVRTVDGVQLATQPLDSRSDGAILLNTSCREGDEVQMAYGDPNQIIQASQQVLSKFRDFAPEGMLLFSCMTRRLFLKEATSQILSEYFKIAPAPGGYVSGEIIRIGKTIYATNMTLITMAIRESDAPLPHQFSAPEDPVVLNETLSTIQRLATFITEATKELQETQKQLSFAATHDSFTGLLNRGSIEMLLVRHIGDMRMCQVPFSAIMVDLDSFKAVNDRFGHDMGDQILLRVSETMKQMIRPTDAAGRWGGDEFVILLPGANLAAASLVAERLRKAFHAIDILPGKEPFTASFGITTAFEGETEQNFYKRMDNALYMAKSAGRNQVILLDSEGQVMEVK